MILNYEIHSFSYTFLLDFSCQYTIFCQLKLIENLQQMWANLGSVFQKSLMSLFTFLPSWITNAMMAGVKSLP